MNKPPRDPCLSHRDQERVYFAFIRFALRWYMRHRLSHPGSQPEEMAHDAASHLALSPSINREIARLISVTPEADLFTHPEIGPYCRTVIVRFGQGNGRRAQRATRASEALSADPTAILGLAETPEPFETTSFRLEEVFGKLRAQAQENPALRRDIDILYDFHILGLTQDEIAAKYDTSRAEPANALRRILKTLRVLGFDC